MSVGKFSAISFALPLTQSKDLFTIVSEAGSSKANWKDMTSELMWQLQRGTAPLAVLTFIMLLIGLGSTRDCSSSLSLRRTMAGQEDESLNSITVCGSFAEGATNEFTCRNAIYTWTILQLYSIVNIWNPHQ